MNYQSTRGKYTGISAEEAIIMGIAPDGGLFVPDTVPVLSEKEWQELLDLNYQARACRIFAYFLENFSQEDIKECVCGAYNEKNFDDKSIAPLVNIDRGLFIQELWHGPTCAFKDMALQILPYLLTVSARKAGEKKEIIILVATSGDTGKAALEGFRDVKGTKIIVFFPEDGVSEVQKMQMITQEGNNVYVAAVKGNFDDAQNGVKQIFGSSDLIDLLAEHGMKMSSANSINWGRLLPQVIYYISAYIDLKSSGQLTEGETINIVVPTGNFGNILAAFYASRMGVPVNKLICASNTNNVLTEFIRTGSYNRNRKFEKTLSPSMDILISSNLERLLYELTGHDGEKVSGWMEELKNTGKYQVDKDILNKIKELFWSEFADDKETLATISDTWQNQNYLLDTHTAVAKNVYDKYLENTGDNTKTIIASTASPFKFGSSVARAVLEESSIKGKNEFEILDALSLDTGRNIPAGIKDLDKRQIRHNTVSLKENMDKTVLNFLGIE